jgi:hypothetical protein
MDDRLQRRLATNEATFRDVNEALQRGHWPGEDRTPIAFRCECARLGCTRLIEMTAREYESVRANPRRFLVAVGHDLPEIETVVEEHGSYVVVEKRDEAGRKAQETDPRS